MVMTRKQKRDVETDIVAGVIAQLEAGLAPWRRSWTTIGGRALRENGKPYRGFNQFILSLAGRTNPFWLTYRKAAALGGQVRKGETSTHVHFFKQWEIKDVATGEDKTVPLIRFYAVFNAEQVDGLPPRYYPEADAEPRNSGARLSDADVYINSTGADISYGGDRALYRPTSDQVRIPHWRDFDSPVAFYGTLLHELGHWTGHKSRLDRDLKNGFGSRDYAREELIAELVASFQCAHLGIENTVREDHAQYIQSWISLLKDDKTALRKACSAAQKAVDFLDDLQPEKKEEAA